MAKKENPNHIAIVPVEMHKLDTHECTLVTFFRLFTKTQKRAILEMMLGLTMTDGRINKIIEKRVAEIEAEESEEYP
jgi:hypothetical protein